MSEDLRGKTLAIIDGKSVFYRGYYAMPNLSTRDGVSTGGVYGFATLALEIIAKLKPDFVAVAWDKSKTNTAKRKEIYADYKANRKPAPPDFYEQVPILKDFLKVLGWPLYELDGYEADDILGTLAHQAKEFGLQTKLITSDLDMLQLIHDGNTEILNIKKGFSDIQKFNQKAFEDKYGIQVEQFVDYKSLTGDSSDNIPGVAGIGPKAACELLNEYKTLENIYENLWKVPTKYQTKLESGKNSAFMSKELATIMLDAPLKLKEEIKHMHGVPANASKLLTTMENLEFRTLIKNLPSFLRDRGALSEANIIESSKVAQKAILKLKSVNNLNDLDIKQDQPTYLYCVSEGKFGKNSKRLYISQNLKEGFIIHPQDFKDLDKLEDLLSKTKVVTYDSKKLLHFFAELKFGGLANLPVHHDLQIVAFLLNSLSRASTLTDLAAQEVKLKLQEDLPPEDLDTVFPEINQALNELYERQVHQLSKLPKLKEVQEEIDQAVVPTLVQMERSGLYVNQKKVTTITKKFERRIDELTKKIHKLAGKEFNIASPKQLGEVLFQDLGLAPTGVKKKKTGLSTAAGELEKMALLHPIISLIQEYRQITKLKGTYLDPIPKLISEEDGRVHGSFNLNVAATGRLSSADPNMQNIPARTELGREVRSIFEAPKGKTLISADYSQVELRIAAAMSDDKDLIKLFNEDHDIHTATAASLAGIPESEVTKEQRYNAKAVNFGILYGQGAHGLAQVTGMTDGEARIFLLKYKEIRSKLFELTDNFIKQAKEQGYVETIYGRRRPTPDIRSVNFNIRAAAERAALNMPIQGTSADITKLAMIKLSKVLPKGAEQVLQVHDSIVVEVDESSAQKVAKLMQQEMEQIAPDLGVKLKVDAKTATSLGEL
ncbi:MAG: DNA polymerase I [Candidatus Nomurabacteria bacterium]|nr:MAG: DNA polymerase I [Candidatus Nomurabacteria bacterium]